MHIRCTTWLSLPVLVLSLDLLVGRTRLDGTPVVCKWRVPRLITNLRAHEIMKKYSYVSEAVEL